MKDMPLTDFDKNTIGSSTRMLKLIFPYFPQQFQVTAACLIRLMEFMETIEYFKRNRISTGKSDFARQGLSMPDIMNEVKKSCTAEELNTINTLETFMKFQQMKQSAEGFLSKEQAEKFKKYQEILNSI